MAYPKIDPEIRFHQRYVIADNGCWLWTRSKSKQGYGKFTIKKGIDVRAHRYAYELFIGPVPPSLLVCHNCDTPSCVNPDHLFLGTPQDNVDDMMAKGRNRFIVPPIVSFKGEANAQNKLKEADVLEIRSSYPEVSAKELAIKFGLHPTTVRQIIRRERWAWLP